MNKEQAEAVFGSYIHKFVEFCHGFDFFIIMFEISKSDDSEQQF